jgi:hypothetical protein
VLPIASVNQTQTMLGGDVLTSNLLAGQYGGRLSWKMPGELRFSTLSLEGDYADVKNPVLFYHQRATTLFVLWTITWGYKHTV